MFEVVKSDTTVDKCEDAWHHDAWNLLSTFLVDFLSARVQFNKVIIKILQIVQNMKNIINNKILFL